MGGREQGLKEAERLGKGTERGVKDAGVRQDNKGTEGGWGEVNSAGRGK